MAVGVTRSGLSWLIEDGDVMVHGTIDRCAGGRCVNEMIGVLLVKLTRGTKMQESPENNLRTEDSICLSVFNLLL
jgi:hypothetical protein